MTVALTAADAVQARVPDAPAEIEPGSYLPARTTSRQDGPTVGIKLAFHWEPVRFVVPIRRAYSGDPSQRAQSEI